MSRDPEIQRMLSVNQAQKRFYENRHDAELRSRGNRLTRAWRRLRRIQQAFRKELGIDDDVNRLHLEWLGDLSQKSVLDLGCYEGNDLSVDIARASSSYLGIDLSSSAIQVLRGKLHKEEISNAEARALDFLSSDFQETYRGKFDVIYAQSVAHHFQYFDVFLRCARNVLSQDGIVVTYDPLQTYPPLKIARTLYRPFQSDREWEFPFSRDTFRRIHPYFEITDVRGVMGRTKWAVPIFILNERAGTWVGKRMYHDDIKATSSIGRGLWRCLQVTMRWKKRTPAAERDV